MSGRKFLTKIVGDMKCKSVGKMSETFVSMTEQLGLDAGQINGYFICERIAASVKIAKYMPASY